MKLHLATSSGNTITGSGTGWIRVGAQEYRESIVVTAELIAVGFAPNGLAALVPSDFDSPALRGCDVVILGTGTRLTFPDPAIAGALAATRIGLEVMDTRAACRTFNVLVAEGRRVAAALIVET